MKIQLRVHIDDKQKDRYTQRDNRPDYALFLPTDIPDNETIPLILSRCYRGVNQWSQQTNRNAPEGYWWRYVRQTGILIAYDLPAEIAKLGYCERESKGRGFVFVLARHPDGKPNLHHPKLEIRPYGDGYSFRWRYPEFNKFKTKHDTGRFLNLSQLVFALRNEEMTYEQALEEWGAESLPELTGKIMTEFDALDLPISESKVYGPASLGKALLQKSGVKIKKIPPRYLGYAMTAFHGPRIEIRIRKQVKPVVYLDFTAMYPTVNALLGNWRILTADKLRVRSYTREARRLLAAMDRDALFDKSLWPKLNGFALVQPDDDLLPVRLDSESTLARLSGSQPLWWAIPDLAASKVLTGRVPKILSAWRLEAEGGSEDDWFVSLVERRQTQPHLTKFLKVLANSASYGVFAEMDPHPTRQVTLYGLDTFTAKSDEIGGRFYFPPVASVITAGARLMLALLQSHVDEYVFCDTDSMAVVADVSKWDEVEEIRKKFQNLNPYSNVPLLKLEKENLVDGERRQLYAYSIAEKSYGLFNLDPFIIRKRTEHTLGYLKSPKPGWIDELWRYHILKGLGQEPNRPQWADDLAINRIKIRTPRSWKQFQTEPFTYYEEPLIGPLGKPIPLSWRTLGPLFADRQCRTEYPDVEVTSIRYRGKETYQLDRTRLLKNQRFYEDRRCQNERCNRPIPTDRRLDASYCSVTCKRAINKRAQRSRRAIETREEAA